MKITKMSCFSVSLFFFFVFSFCTCAHAQSGTIIPFDSSHWSIQAKELSSGDFDGKQCITMVDGAAYLKDKFENGIVEFDINFEKGRSFPGLLFRVADDRNYDFVYLRPHQSGNPDAIQYCPVISGIDTWQLYNGDGYCAQKEFQFNTWTHVKVVISGTMGELYLDNEATPTLFMYHLQRDPVLGGLALDNHSSVKVRFANFSYCKLSAPPIKSAAKTLPPLEPGIVKKWQVSSTFGEKDLDHQFALTPDKLNGLGWQSLSPEELGFVNLGKHVVKTNEKNTVFARFDLESGKSQIKQLSIGFSDRCKVYLNGKLLYAGNNTFKSRDYRFYGTIGYWDQVFLDLKKGKNEVVIAVAENFGGWGIEAKLDDLTDLDIK